MHNHARYLCYCVFLLLTACAGGGGGSGGGGLVAPNDSLVAQQFPGATVVDDQPVLATAAGNTVGALAGGQEIAIGSDMAMRQGSLEVYDTLSGKVLLKVEGGEAKDIKLLNNGFLLAGGEVTPGSESWKNHEAWFKKKGAAGEVVGFDSSSVLSRVDTAMVVSGRDTGLEHATFGAWIADYHFTPKDVPGYGTVDERNVYQPFYGGAGEIQKNPAGGDYTGSAIGRASEGGKPQQTLSGTASLTVTGSQAVLVIDFPTYYKITFSPGNITNGAFSAAGAVDTSITLEPGSARTDSSLILDSKNLHDTYFDGKFYGNSTKTEAAGIFGLQGGAPGTGSTDAGVRGAFGVKK